jgi:pimeloyl-ACP methyl ester carboxylesterase
MPSKILSSVLTSLCLAVPGVVGQTTASFQFTEKPGPHAVGLRVIEQFDYSRTYRAETDNLGKPYTGERARPLQTLVWYPAEKSTASPMKVGDYFDLRLTETSFGQPQEDRETSDWREGMKASFGSSLWAVRNAPPASGHFPVVIYAPSFSAPATENADLCEYLASNGYVVIASADMGATTRGMTGDLTGIDAEARDISFLIAYAKTLANTDTSQVAVAGFSWGGISNLFAAARDNRIKALVSLDGSARYFPKLIKESGYVHPDEMALPLMFFTQGETPMELDDMVGEFDKATPLFLNQWTHGDLVKVDMLGMIHVEFSSMYQRNEQIWRRFDQMKKADYGREDGYVSYGWVARYALQFLNAYLKYDAEALAFLKRTPLENGVPKHLMTVTYRPAKGMPLTLDAFRAELGRRGFDHTADLYAEMTKQKPDFKLNQGQLNDWAMDLLTQKHVSDALALLNLNAQMYPDSSDVYDGLAEAYKKTGKNDLAIENYKKALTKNPADTDAMDELKKLNAAPKQ